MIEWHRVLVGDDLLYVRRVSFAASPWTVYEAWEPTTWSGNSADHVAVMWADGKWWGAVLTRQGAAGGDMRERVEEGIVRIFPEARGGNAYEWGVKVRASVN